MDSLKMFKTDNRFFDEMAKAATGAVSALSGAREQIRSEIKTQINRFIAEMDFVPREDFETVEAMAVEARLQNAKLEKRIVELEKRAGVKTAAAPKAVKKPVAKKKPTRSSSEAVAQNKKAKKKA
jgi:BMFP domain-containing protein YqiC